MSNPTSVIKVARHLGKVVCCNNVSLGNNKQAFECVEINIVYVFLCLSCQHSFNVFEKGVSLIQGPSSLAGQSCYLSADF